MRVGTSLLVGCAFVFFMALAAIAQDNKAFVGTWEEIDGTVQGHVSTGHAGMRRIFTPDGFYSITFTGLDRDNIVCKRSKTTKSLKEITAEELRDRFECIVLQDGKFTVSGNRLNVTRRSADDPRNEGTVQIMEWNVENGILSLKIISDTGTAPVGQVTRYHRLKTGDH
jgi:hypothetical protein